MLNKKIIIISLLLIALISLTAVFAADNETLSESNDLEDKKDLDATLEFRDEIPRSMTLHVNNFDIRVTAPEDYNETISVFVDEDMICQENIKNFHHGLYAFEYELGEHTLRANFPENDIYKELNLTKNFKVSETVIGIGENSVSVRTAADVTGTVTIMVNDTQYKKVDLSKIEDRALGYSTQMNDLDIGTYKITVIYSGDSKYKRVEKTQIITRSYPISADYSVRYYGDKLWWIYPPSDIKNKKLDVVIDGMKYPVKYDSDDGFCVDVGNLGLGIHNYTITYNGDSRYPKKTVNGTFDIYTGISGSCMISYGENATVSLNIPTNENGTLTIYMSEKNYIQNPNDDLKYAAGQLTNGSITINISGLNVGRYYVLVEYSGITNIKSLPYTLDVAPKIIAPNETFYTDKTTIYAIADKNANGVMTLDTITDEDVDKYLFINIVNGSGNVTFTKFPIQRYVFSSYFDTGSISFAGENFILTVKGSTPILSKNKDITMYYHDGTSYSVKVKDEYGKYTNNRFVTFKIGKSTYKVETDDNGVAKIKINELPGKYRITATYGGVSVTNNVVVKKMLTLSTVKVKKSSSKLVLTAKLAKKIKGKQITFKFNGKKYTAKTNKKGVAKVTIKSKYLKKLKVGKKVNYQATYLKDTVKKSVKVKK